METLETVAEVEEVRRTKAAEWHDVCIVDEDGRIELRAMKRGEISWTPIHILTGSCVGDLLIENIVRLRDAQGGKKTYTFHS